MRELIYLSERKLQQFHAEPKRNFLRRVTQFGAKGPGGLGEVSVSLAAETANSHPQLAEVLDLIERSDRPSKWYEDETVGNHS